MKLILMMILLSLSSFAEEFTVETLTKAEILRLNSAKQAITDAEENLRLVESTIKAAHGSTVEKRKDSSVTFYDPTCSYTSVEIRGTYALITKHDNWCVFGTTDLSGRVVEGDNKYTQNNGNLIIEKVVIQ
jgi:hypothetical protein